MTRLEEYKAALLKHTISLESQNLDEGQKIQKINDWKAANPIPTPAVEAEKTEKGAKDLAKTTAVATETALVTAVNSSAGTESKSDPDSSDTQVDNEAETFDTDRYIQFKSGRSYESDYLEKYAGKGRYPNTFDEYAKTKGTTPVIPAVAGDIGDAAVVNYVTPEIQEEIVDDVVGADIYQDSRYRYGDQTIAESTESLGIPVDEEGLHTADFGYEKGGLAGSGGNNWTNSNPIWQGTKELFSSSGKVNINTSKATVFMDYEVREEGDTYTELTKTIKKLKGDLEVADKDEIPHIEKALKEAEFKLNDNFTTREGVEIINVPKQIEYRLSTQGINYRNHYNSKDGEKAVAKRIIDKGYEHLSDDDKELYELNKEWEAATGEEKTELGKKIEKIAEDDELGSKLSDKNTGDLIDMSPETIQTNEEAAALAAKTGSDVLKSQLIDYNFQMVGLANDWKALKGDGLLETITSNVSSDEDAEMLSSIAKTGLLPSDFHKLDSDSPIAKAFNEIARKYEVTNKAIQINRNPLTDATKEYFFEAFDSVINILGFDVDTKREAKDTFLDVLAESGTADSKYIKRYRGENKTNIMQDVMIGIPHLAQFVGEVAFTKKVSGNTINRGFRLLERYTDRLIKGNRYARVGSKAVYNGLIEFGEFALTTALTNSVFDRDESILESAKTGGAFGFGGTLGRQFFGSIGKAWNKSSLSYKAAETGIYRRAGKSKLVQTANRNFQSASGGATSYIVGSALMDPLDYKYEDIGRTYITEFWKMYFLGKFKAAVTTPAGSLRSVYENVKSDILSYQNLNSQAHKGAGILNIDTKEIKKPNEDTQSKIDAAHAAKQKDVTNRKENGEISKEIATAEYKSNNQAKLAVENNVAINQAKAVIEANRKLGDSPTPGEEYIATQKLKSGADLNARDSKTVSNLSPELLLDGMGVVIAPGNLTRAKEYIDSESALQSILDGGRNMFVTERGFEFSEEIFEGEYKALSGKLRDETYNFIRTRVQLDAELHRLNKTSTSDLTPIEKSNLEEAKNKSELALAEYIRGGNKYEILQDKISKETLRLYEIDKATDVSRTEEGLYERAAEEKLTKDEFQKAYDAAFKDKADVREHVAFIDPNTGNRFINKERALEVRNTNAFSHEGDHFLLIDVLKDTNDKISPGGVDAIDNILSSLSPKRREILDKEVKSRYPEATEENKGDWYEENLTILGELIQDKIITFNKPLGESLKGLLPFFKKKYFKNLKIDSSTGEGMFEMLKGLAENAPGAVKAAKRFTTKAKAEATTKTEAAKGGTFSKSTPLEAINALVPNTVKTQADYFSPRVFNPIYKALEDNGVISNYIKSRSPSKEVASKTIESIRERLTNFNPETDRKNKDNLEPITFGEFIFANTNFGKLDAKKKLFQESEAEKKTTDLDNKEAQRKEAGESSAETKSKKKYAPLTANNKLAPNFLINEIKLKLSDIVSKLTSTLSARPKGGNAQTTPLIAEIKKAIGNVVKDPKALPKQIIDRMGNPKDGSYQTYLIDNKKSILENLTTTSLMTLIPQAVEKSVGGRYEVDSEGKRKKDSNGNDIFKPNFVSYSEWKGQKIDREKVSTNKKGGTSGNEIVRRAIQVENKEGKFEDSISNEDFVANFVGKDGKVVRGKREALGKALAEEISFEVLNKELTNENSEIRKAFKNNQLALNEVLLDNFVEQISRDTERGTVKFSKVAIKRKVQLPLIEGMNTEEFKNRFFTHAKNPKNKTPLLTSIIAHFTESPIEGLKPAELKLIAKELSKDYTFGKFGEIGVERIEQFEGLVKTLKYIISNTSEGLIRGNSYDTAQLLNKGVDVKLDTKTLEGLNEGREETLKVIKILADEGFTGNEIKNIFTAFYGPAGLGGFQGKLGKDGKARAVPNSVVLIKSDLGLVKRDKDGKLKDRGALMISEADFVQNFLKGIEMGDKVSTRTDAHTKNFWSKANSVYNKLDNKDKKEYLQELQKSKDGYQTSLIKFIEAVHKADLTPAAQRTLIRAPFAAMDGLGKITSAPRWMPAKMDGTLLSLKDLVKLGFGREDGKEDMGVFEHTKPANRVAIAAYIYSMTGSKTDLAILKEELVDFDTAFITEGMDKELVRNKLQSLMGLNYVRGAGVMATRYAEMIQKMNDAGLTFYDAKTNTLLSPGGVLGPQLNKLIKSSLKPVTDEQKAINNGRSANFSKSPKKIRTFDFDFTLAKTKSKVVYTKPNLEGGFSEGATKQKAIFMVGGPGAGKTNVGKGLKLGRQGYKVVNQDIALEAMKTESGLPANESEYNAEQRSERSKIGAAARKAAVAKFDKYTENGDGMVIDGTGASYKATTKKIKALEDAGFEVHMVVATTPLETALERNTARVERSLPDFVVKKTYDQVQKSLVDYRKDFGDRLYEIDTDAIEYGKDLPNEFLERVYAGINANKVGKLDAGTFAEKAVNMEAEGAVWNFSEFSKVIGGEKGPLFDVAKMIADKRGTEDVFVLTARPQDAAGPIKAFLKGLGLNIPLKNITGLGNGSPKAKADWMISKVADGYNDFYFADDHTGNVKAVKNLLDTFDVKSRVQLAKVKFSKSLDPEFNKMIERNKGVGSEKEFSKVVAKRRGANIGKYKIFFTSSADDFRGLTSYTFAGKGKQGEADQRFFEDALLTPYFRGVNALESARVAIKSDFTQLSKIFKPEVKKLGKLTPDGDFTYDQALRVFMWNKQGIEVPGLSKRDQAKLVKLVEEDAGLVAFADAAVLATKKDGWPDPGEHWDAKTMLSDLNDLTESSNRAEYLTEFNENADIIFSEKNLNKIEAVYGTRHREALEDALYAMKKGTNRTSGSNKITNGWNNWVNSSIGTIMFFNRRSALLQTLSITNFINWSDNNPLKAGIAFANQPQYWKDFAMIFNSDKLKQRRGGLKSDVQEAEIANAAKGAKNKPQAIVSYLLKKGFLPTQIADSFAISMGGASMYRNRVNTYKKQGLDQKAAEEKAFLDFSKLSDETQQSGDPALVSQQQRSVAGRLILSFQNTTMQYNRLMKKSAQDLVNRRGDPKTHISKILYYGAVMNFTFNALSNSLFTLIPGFGDDDEDETEGARQKKIDNKTAKILNGMFDSLAKGTGIHGAIVSTLKNAYIKYSKEKEKGFMGQPGWQASKELLNIAPAIGSKFTKVKSAIDVAEIYDKDIIEKHPWDVTIDGKFNPSSTYTVVGNLSSALLNVPLDRVLIEARGISEAMDDRNTTYQRIALGLGWRTWNVGAENEEFDQIKLDASVERKEEKARKKESLKTPSEKLKDLNKAEQVDILAKSGMSKEEIKALQYEKKRVEAIIRIREQKKSPKKTESAEVTKEKELVKRKKVIKDMNKPEQVEILSESGLSKKQIRALKSEASRIDAIIEIRNKKKTVEQKLRDQNK